MICFPFHNLQDEYEETRLGQGSFGSTRQGIAPVYGDRYMKYGVQVGASILPRLSEAGNQPLSAVEKSRYLKKYTANPPSTRRRPINGR